ncbi:MAG TPA: DUF2808 domain-containing protein [Cyanophyceae cyanobacterium]
MSRISRQVYLSPINVLGFSSLIVGAMLLSSLLSRPALAVFEHSPRLILMAAASYPGIGASVRYQFTISVPADAGEPLQAITITQRENLERIRFELGTIHAFAGGDFSGGPAVSLASIGGNEPSNSNEITVAFDPPIQPGNTVTVSIKGRHPSSRGVYLFGVTAFAAGENRPGLYLGERSISFP